MSQTCTCNTCGRTEHNQLLVWNKCEQCQRIEYLESEIANYETARQEDAKRLEQVTTERDEMREIVKQLEWITGKKTGIQSCVVCGASIHRGRHFDDCTLAAALKGGK